MGERGKVINIENHYASVILKRTEACAKCGLCSGLSDKEMTVKVKNACGAVVGDFVEIELRDGIFIRSALIAYGVPFVMFFIGIAAGFLLARLFGIGQYEEISAFITGFVFVVASYFILKEYDSKMEKERYEPIAVKIVNPNLNLD